MLTTEKVVEQVLAERSTTLVDGRPAGEGTPGDRSEAMSKKLAAEARAATAVERPFLPWALDIHEPQTGKLNFDRFPYLHEPYAVLGDVAQAVVKKGTQVGLSTLALRWALWVADQRSGTVMYVFPVVDQVYKFSDQRIKPVIRGSKYLREQVAADDPDNKGLKKIGRGYVYFVGSRSVTELDSVPANALVLDEYDELAQINIPVVERRVGAAHEPMIRRIGVPTLDNYGIEREYRTTDMRRWKTKCPGCNEWQPITWENVRYEETAPEEYIAERVCVKCGVSLEQAIEDGIGEWVAEHPDRPRIGFHVPRLIVPSADLGAIVRARLSEKEEEKRAHYNRDLAEPFETPESRLSGSAIESCRRPDIRMVESYTGFNWVTMGIDVSTTRGLHVRISEHINEHEKRALWIGMVDAIITANPDEPDRSALYALAQKMAAYKVHMALIDHLPDGLFARAFCAAHPGRAYMVAYNTDYRAREHIKYPKPGTPEPLVVIKRVEWITATLDLFRHQRNLLPGSEPLPRGVEGKTYEEHLRNIVKQRKSDTIGREYYGYEATGPEDFLQAEVYDNAATQVMMQRRMEQAIDVGMQAEQEVAAPNPTPDLSEWDRNPLIEEPDRSIGSTYGPDWDQDDEYRP